MIICGVSKIIHTISNITRYDLVNFPLDSTLSSTERLIVGVSEVWTVVCPLPNNLVGPRATTVNNKIYLLGHFI